jgi:hypothetical protein
MGSSYRNVYLGLVYTLGGIRGKLPRPTNTERRKAPRREVSRAKGPEFAVSPGCYPCPMDQVKSRQRVVDHGEVFTPGWMVEAMLDLVKDESERIESRFLEPACGSGNFLIQVLKRKFAAVNKRYGRYLLCSFLLERCDSPSWVRYGLDRHR